MAVKPVSGGGLDYTIPKAILEEFQKSPRIILKIHPAGLWPIPIDILRKTNILDRMARDPEFLKNNDIVIVPK